MGKLKRLCDKKDEIVVVEEPLTDEESKERHREYQQLSVEAFKRPF